jgi:hypothetical protein
VDVSDAATGRKEGLVMMDDELLQEMIDPAPQRGDVSRWRRLGATAAIFALAGLGVTSLTTSALFTDRETTAGDLLTGTVDLSLGATDFAVTTTGLAPGQSVAKQVTVANDGSLALRYAVSYKADPVTTGLATAPDLGDTADLGTDAADLRDQYTLEVFQVGPTTPCVQTPDTAGTSEPRTLVKAHPATLDGYTPILGDANTHPFQDGLVLGVDEANKTNTLCVRATFDADADNGYQAKGMEISLRFDAEQVVNNSAAEG